MFEEKKAAAVTLLATAVWLCHLAVPLHSAALTKRFLVAEDTALYVSNRSATSPQVYRVKWQLVIRERQQSPSRNLPSDCSPHATLHLVRDVALLEELQVNYQPKFANEIGPIEPDDRILANRDCATQADLRKLAYYVRPALFAIDKGLLLAELEDDRERFVIQTFATEQQLVLRGGAVDKNLTRIYWILYENGRLPTRTIVLNAEHDSLERTLVTEGVIFKKAPPPLEKLLVALNEDNDSVSIRGRGANRRVRFNGYASLVVPSLQLSFVEYPLFITVPANRMLSSLEHEANRRNLLRQSYQRNSPIPLSKNDVKLERLYALNPTLRKLLASKAPHSVKHANVLFPADTIRVPFPRDLLNKENLDRDGVDELRKLLRENVFLDQTSLSPRSIPGGSGEVVKALDSCDDPLASDFAGQLRTTGLTQSFLNKAVAKYSGPPVFLLDFFQPLKQERLHERRARLIYRNFVYSQLKEFRYFPRSEVEKLFEILRTQFGISEADAEVIHKEVDRLQDRNLPLPLLPPVEAGFRAPFIVDLEKHPEFIPCQGRQCVKNDGQLSLQDLKRLEEAGDHGYHLAVIIAGLCNGAGIRGIAPQLPVRGYRLKHEGNDALEDPVTAQEALLAIMKGGECTERHPCVVNMSFSDPVLVGTEKSADGKDRPKDALGRALLDFPETILAVAAASESTDYGRTICVVGAQLISPGCFGTFRNVLTVTAGRKMAGNVVLMPGADFGDVVGIVAPGVDIPSMGASEPLIGSGTSQAVAFVTATAALLKSYAKGQGVSLTPQEIKERILYTADLHALGPTDRDKIQFGWLNGWRAIDRSEKDILSIGGERIAGELVVVDTLWPFIRLFKRNGEARDISIRNIRRIERLKNGSLTVVYREYSKLPYEGYRCSLAIQREVYPLPQTSKGEFVSEKSAVFEGYLTSRFKFKAESGEPRDNVSLMEFDELVIRAGNVRTDNDKSCE